MFVILTDMPSYADAHSSHDRLLFPKEICLCCVSERCVKVGNSEHMKDDDSESGGR